ncbi:HAMP domain-containing protein [Oxalobacteraceae bacterium OM1]|nr:HAMP domain-containing protein [Oxalobacteraceae bacterium OM1]
MPSFRIGTRLLLSFGLLLVFGLLVTLLALWRLHSVDGMAKALVNDKLAKQQLAAHWLGVASTAGGQANAVARSDSLEVADYFGQALQAADRELAAIEQRWSGLPQDAAERDLAAAIARTRTAYLALREQVFKFKVIGKTIDAEQLANGDMAARFRDYQAAIGALAELQKQRAQAIALESEQVYRNSVVLLLGLGAFATALGGALAWRLIRSIVQPLREAAALVERAAAGDLRPGAWHPRQDELGMLLARLQGMNASLAAIVGEVRDGVHAIDGALVDIADDNSKLAQRTVGQAQALKRIAALMEEMRGAVTQNASNARHADALASDATRVAREGGGVVADVVRTMDSIHAASQRVSDIVSVIDGIAFQTNILALNAAVEAARAGEHGRGFAVVAAEVRNLAQRATTAAREVKTVIGASVEEVEAGSRLVNEAGTTMRRIVDGIERVSVLMGDIRTASETQRAGLEEVGNAIDDIDAVTRHNAALVDDAVAATSALRTQSQRVAASVNVFCIEEDGTGIASDEAEAEVLPSAQTVPLRLAA